MTWDKNNIDTCRVFLFQLSLVLFPVPGDLLSLNGIKSDKELVTRRRLYMMLNYAQSDVLKNVLHHNEVKELKSRQDILFLSISSQIS